MNSAECRSKILSSFIVVGPEAMMYTIPEILVLGDWFHVGHPILDYFWLVLNLVKRKKRKK
eukprot:snap_masked-scaffold_77-processed-gene-0.23-mRNA-1 protein AED:1.00 eAED:1.00 QI:0/0/0/0/1/1/2/0/60